MAVQTLDPIQVRKIGFKVLGETLGPVDMVRFLHFFETGEARLGSDLECRMQFCMTPILPHIGYHL